MKSIKKWLILILVFALAAAAVACTGGDTTGTTTATTKSTTSSGSTTAGNYEWEYMEDTSPFEFDIWWVSHWGFNKDAIVAGWDDNIPVYKLITEATGGRINFVMPEGTENELLGPMIAAGTLPDVIVLGDNKSPYYYQMKDAGQIYAWSDLIAEHCPKMWDLVLESNKVFHTEADGKLYKYVSMIADEVSGAGLEAIGLPACSHSNISFARKDILAAFGAQDLTDINQLTDYLRFCKANYPDVDPIRLFLNDPRSESTPFFRHLGATFGCHLSGTYPAADGTLKFYMYDPNYVAYLQWLNGLFREGIITTNMLAEDSQAQETRAYNAGYGFMVDSMWGAYGTVNDTIRTNLGSDVKTFIDVGPIKKDGHWESDGYRNTGSFATLITTGTKQPDRVIKMFEFLLTEEGQMLINAGPDGWAYEIKDGKYIPKSDALELASKNLQEYTTKYRLSGPWAFIAQDYYWEYYLGQLLNPDGYIKDQTYARLKPYIRPIWDEGFVNIRRGIIKEAGNDIDVLNTRINNICIEAGMKMVIAGSDADFQKIYTDCIAEIEAQGVAQIHTEYTELYNDYKEKLGLK
jgi:putative aldouronate transport system substrate-binding protein